MAKPVRKRVPVAGAELDVLVGGRDEPGAATLCTAHPVESMDASLSLLADITRARVVCVNPRGVGRSSPPEHPSDSTLEVTADDLDAVRRRLGLPRWVIWGMSGGSMIAQVYAHRHPESLDALILDSAGPCFSVTLRDAGCVMSASFPRWREALAAAGLLPELESARTSQAAPDDVIWEELSNVGCVLRSASGRVRLVFPGAPSSQMRRVMPHLLTFDARPWLGDIRVPTLVMGGAGDQVAPPAQLRALHEAIPGSSLELIEGAGHVPVQEKPDEVAVAVRGFLYQRVWP